MSTYAVSGKPWPSSEVPHIDGLDQSGDNGVIQACVIEVRELVHGGAIVEALGVHGEWGS